MYENNHYGQIAHAGNEMTQFQYECPPIYSNIPWHPTPTYENSQTKDSNQSLPEIWNQRKRDAEFFNKFMDENSATSVITSGKKTKVKRLGIADTKNLILSIKSLNSELEMATLVLQEKKNSSAEEWQENIEKCRALKNNIQELIKQLVENERICSFKVLVEERKRKRLGRKNSLNRIKARKILEKERRARLHAATELWMREKQAIIEREKQEENWRREADLVLSDVRGKRSDSRKFLGILQELQNLRKAMANNARARGEKLSPAADKVFENIIMQLSEQWSELDREYSIEEQGLKLMINKDNEQKIAKQKKSSFDEWETAIFGRRLPMLGNLQKDFNNLVMIRFAWDKYINYDTESSRIPLGWIMPEPPKSAAWQKCLKK